MSAINKLIICDNSNKFATAKKVRKNWGWGGGEGEENTPSCTFVKEKIPQEEQ